MITTDSKAVRYGSVHSIKTSPLMFDILKCDGDALKHRGWVRRHAPTILLLLSVQLLSKYRHEEINIRYGPILCIPEISLKFLLQHYLENLFEISLVNVKGLLCEKLQLVPALI